MRGFFGQRFSGRPVLSPFPSPSALAKSQLKSILELSKLSFQRGWNPGTGGNFSVRDNDDLCWVSVSGKNKGELTLGDFLPIQIESAFPVPPCYKKPSDETAVHCAIYRSDATARAVLHVHTPETVALVREPMVLQDNEMLKVFGIPTHEAQVVVPCLPNTQDMISFGQQLPALLDSQMKLLVLEGHGVYGWGRDADEAMYRIEALEYLCSLWFLRNSK